MVNDVNINSGLHDGVSMAMPKEMIWSFQVGKQEQIHNLKG